tara:strand:- start:118 stop:474 length:357 start_codon:yes stop_codon:yes gene_type:complete
MKNTIRPASTVSVTDSTANTDFPLVFHNESNALHDDTGSLTYNPSNGNLTLDRASADLTIKGGNLKVKNASGTTNLSVSTNPTTAIIVMTNLPTSDPGSAGQLWKNASGTLKISSGGA